MGESIIQRAFAAGEIAPVLHARADTVKYQTGLKTCRNFLVRKEGGVSNRAGFRFVEACKTDTFGTRLMRFVGSEEGESFLIEMGAGYFRFFQNGAAVESSPGVAYEVATPYSLGQLPDWKQSGNVITLTHPNHAPRELAYTSPTSWALTILSTAAAVVAPTGLVGTPGAAGLRTFKYIVTAAASDTYEESDGCPPSTVNTTLEGTPDAPIALTWDAAVGIAEWYIYCDPYENGVYGYIGTATTNAFKDVGFVPDFNLTPPTARVLFNAAGDYPTNSANYQQRAYFANTLNAPDSIFGSRVGFGKNFGVSSPLQDDDSVTFRIAGNNQHPIRHMVALKAGLILLTGGGEWTVTGAGGATAPVTPSSINADQETYVGISKAVRPAVVGNAIIYLQARGSVIRELHFDKEVEGLAGKDMTIFATHLFARETIVALDYQQIPHSIVWCARSDGELVGLTYIPEQDVWGWHRHDTEGDIEDVCVVPEEEEDVLYIIVERSIGGVDKRYIERLERREILEGFVHSTSFFVDSGLSYSGAPATTFSGLDHLEGERVAIYADGEVVSNGRTGTTYAVVGGAVTIPTAASNVHIGLPIPRMEIQTLDVDVEGSAIRDKKKRVSSVSILIERSSQTFQAGSDDDALRTFEPKAWDGTADLNTKQLELPMTADYDTSGSVIIRQDDPLPLTILGVIPHVDLGG